MNRFPLKPATAVLAATLLAACSANAPKEAQPAPQVRQVTQSAHCGLTGPGVEGVWTLVGKISHETMTNRRRCHHCRRRTTGKKTPQR